ncbi:MAG: hypothetical protein ABFS45_24030 [Pseudomonadota bacterium]
MLSSTGITRRLQYYHPIRHPKGPGLCLATYPLARTLPQPPQGVSRVARIPMYTHAIAITPVDRLGARVVHLPQPPQPSQSSRSVGIHIVLFEACSAFTARYGLCARRDAQRLVCLGSFDGFVTSTIVPIATGWNDLWPGGSFTH